MLTLKTLDNFKFILFMKIFLYILSIFDERMQEIKDKNFSYQKSKVVNAIDKKACS